MQTSTPRSNLRIGALMRDPKAIRVSPETESHDGDYMIFIDESGDAQLDPIHPHFPLLNLVCVLIRKDHYLDHLVPRLSAIKTQFFGRTDVVLHESEMRQKQGPFAIFKDQQAHYRCVEALLTLLNEAPIHIIAACIHKSRLKARYTRPFHPYALAMRFCLERIQSFLQHGQQAHLRTQVIFESRGKRDDQLALKQFTNIYQHQQPIGRYQPNYTRFPMEPLFIAKHANVAGLQISDLVAGPMARDILTPGSQARVMQAISPKLIARKVFPDAPYGLGKTRVSPAENSRHAISYPDHAVFRTMPSPSAHTST